MKKILCKFHEEKTPSMVLYPDGYHCYGCGAHGPLSQLGMESSNIEEVVPENLHRALQYIYALPTKVIRGLAFPYDDNNYYIVWPSQDYYKSRNQDRKYANKYYNPRRIKKPVFYLEGMPDVPSIIVEGEINALSLKEAFRENIVISPGSAQDLASGKFLRELSSEGLTKQVLCIADNDEAGKNALLTLQYKLRNMGYDTYGIAMKEDANDVLVKHGKEKLYEEIRPVMERFLKAE